MIIACPSCNGPFEIPNDHIAPLVQVDCPHCNVRNIFDFAAANDPSLLEEAHGQAAGFLNADDYRRFKSSGQSFDVAEPAPAQQQAATGTSSARSTPTSTPTRDRQPVGRQHRLGVGRSRRLHDLPRAGLAG